MKQTFRLIIALFLFQSCTINSNTSNEINESNLMQQIIYLVDTSDSLSIRGVKEIPSNVFKRIDLKYLSVWGQDCDVAGFPCYAIKEIPSEIQKLKHLEELHLTLNYITKLPANILELKHLRVLNLTENPGFNDIETVVKMKTLEEFYCYGCYLSDEEIKQLKQELPNCAIGVE